LFGLDLLYNVEGLSLSMIVPCRRSSRSVSRQHVYVWCQAPLSLNSKVLDGLWPPESPWLDRCHYPERLVFFPPL